jgi:hypothetical protein
LQIDVASLRLYSIGNIGSYMSYSIKFFTVENMEPAIIDKKLSAIAAIFFA